MAGIRVKMHVLLYIHIRGAIHGSGSGFICFLALHMSQVDFVLFDVSILFQLTAWLNYRVKDLEFTPMRAIWVS